MDALIYSFIRSLSTTSASRFPATYPINALDDAILSNLNFDFRTASSISSSSSDFDSASESPGSSDESVAGTDFVGVPAEEATKDTS